MDLEKLLESPHLPTLPTVAIRLLEISKNPDAEVGEVIEAVKSDPAIAAKILKASNSSYFGFRREVTSIDRVVPLLGINVVSSLALSFSLVDDSLNDGPLAKHYEDYWRQSIVQAAATETVGMRNQHGIACEYFLAGLLMDIGRLVMLKTLRQEYMLVLEQAAQQDQQLFQVELNAFGFDHAMVGARLMEKWGLDPCLQIVAKAHHWCPDNLNKLSSSPYFMMVKTVAIASSVCDYLCTSRLAESIERTRNLGETLFQFSQQAIEDLLAEIRTRVDSVAEMYSVDVSQVGDPQELMSQAKEQLVQLAMRQHVSMNQAMERQQQAEREKLNLENQNQQLKEKAFFDPLTEIYNRRYFDETFQNESARCAREQKPLGLLMTDIDHFKNLNDTYGHQFGDLVLQHAAKRLKDTLRDCDIVARYGGEEFVILAHQPTLDGLTTLAERIRCSIESLCLEFEGQAVAITISVGAAIVDVDQKIDELNECLIGLADAALYESKRNGRNRVTVREFEASNPVALPIESQTPPTAVANNLGEPGV